MNKYLEQLVALSKVDKEIDNFEPRIKKIEHILRAEEDKKANILEKMRILEEEIKESKLKKNQHDLHLQELSSKLSSTKKKSSALKTEKEIKALQLEEEIAKEQCDFANEEIERLDKIIEIKISDIQEVQAQLGEMDEKIEEISKNISTQLETIEKERKEVYSQKEQLVSKVSAKILTFYEKIRKWAHNTAVVPVRKQACYGCFMRIYDKTYSAIIKSEDIVTCPHCGRILYKETEEVSNGA